MSHSSTSIAKLHRAVNNQNIPQESRRYIRRMPIARAALAIALPLAFAACSSGGGLPKPDSQEYRDLVTAFYVGLAGLQTGEDIRAKEKLTRATEIAPGEPAGWANLGLLAVKEQGVDAAYEEVEKDSGLAPDTRHIETRLGASGE